MPCYIRPVTKRTAESNITRSVCSLQQKGALNLKFFDVQMTVHRDNLL